MDIRKEIEFWTRIMRDHGEFQFYSLAASEQEALNTAQYFRNLFDRLHIESRSNQLPIADLIAETKTAVTQFIDFKRYMLSRLMTCTIKLSMTPTFLNHMINEALEFLHALNLADNTIQSNNVMELLRLHTIWLPDASGHASFVAAELDSVEREYIKEADKFTEKFDNLFKKAFSMYSMYERTRVLDGAIHHLNEQVKNALREFIVFLEAIEELNIECSILPSGTFSPLIANHMMREEGYYIYKISELGERFG